MFLNLSVKFLDADIIDSFSGHHRHLPPGYTGTKPDHNLQLSHQITSPRAVSLIYHKDVGNLKQACLHRLNSITGLRNQDHHHSIYILHYIQLSLSHPHRLHQNKVLPEGTHQLNYTASSPRQTTMTTTRRHTSNENPLIKIMLLHPYPIPKNSTTCKRAGRVSGNYTHRKATLPQHRWQPVHHGALTCSWRSGYAYAISLAQMRIDPLHYLRYFSVASLHLCNQP